MATINYSIDVNCSSHPLFQTHSLPINSTIRVDPHRLFCYATLTLQDPSKPAFQKYSSLKKKMSAMIDLYDAYLFDNANGFSSDATGEDLTTISTFVGVSLGAILLCSTTKLNPNRLIRYQGTGKRMDFEFQKHGMKFFHEMKGTTYPNTFKGLIKDILSQKGAPSTNGAAGRTGSIAIYEKHSPTLAGTHVYLIDPPIHSEVQKFSENDELIEILLHYSKVFETVGGKGILNWITDTVIPMIRRNERPNTSPREVNFRCRVSEPHPQKGDLYTGAIIDSRLFRHNLIKYNTFNEATEAIKSPIYFYGISMQLIQLLKQCKWEDVIQYLDINSELNIEDSPGCVMPSGVASWKITNPVENMDDYEKTIRKDFINFKKRLSMDI